MLKLETAVKNESTFVLLQEKSEFYIKINFLWFFTDS